jgi:hypothetical protein
MADPLGESSAARSDVQLCVTLPASVREAIRAAAKREGITVRTLLLRALRDAGIPGIADAELTDRRAAVAALKARLYREAGHR